MALPAAAWSMDPAAAGSVVDTKEREFADN